MSRPKLWVDIDDVLSQTSIFALQKLRHYHNFELWYDELTGHRWELLPNFPLSEKSMFEFWDQHLSSNESINEILPVEWAVKSISALAQRYELHAITARTDCMKDATKAWLGKHFSGAFCSVNHLGWEGIALRTTKGEFCRDLGVVAMIEDHMTYALTVAEHQIPCYLLSRPWNLLRKESHSLILRRESWDWVTSSLLDSIDTNTWRSL